MIFGVMKKISSWVWVFTVLRLNRFPSTGISPSSGTCWMLTVFWVWMDAADYHRTAVGDKHLRRRLLRNSAGLPFTACDLSGVVFSTSTARNIVFSTVICGVTVRRNSAST